MSMLRNDLQNLSKPSSFEILSPSVACGATVACVPSEISPMFTGPSGGTARAEAQATQEIERETPGRHQHKVDLCCH